MCPVDDVVDDSDDNEEAEADTDTENDEDEKDNCMLVHTLTRPIPKRCDSILNPTLNCTLFNCHHSIPVHI